MASGRQLGEQNYQTFVAWMAGKTDEEFRSMESRGVLSRKEIAIECGFAKSALDQNPAIKASLSELERSLRSRGVLPLPAEQNCDVGALPVQRERDASRSSIEAERLRRLEQENASLRAEVSELKRIVEQYAVLRDALALSGRVPR